MRKYIFILIYLIGAIFCISNSKAQDIANSENTDIYPNAVDTKTQAQITSRMDTIDGYRMIAEKRRRLEYIYEQNRAQAMRQAMHLVRI